MLAIGRALMSKPKLLLMDEPSMGLSPILVQEIFKIIRDVRDSAPPSSSSSRTPGSAEDRG
jgi:branched-chain amino acid transport system ATP-binding protein